MDPIVFSLFNCSHFCHSPVASFCLPQLAPSRFDVMRRELQQYHIAFLPLTNRPFRLLLTTVSAFPQLAPFPFDLMLRELRRYPNAQLMWVQEEPLNMGAFQHVSHRIETCMRHEVGGCHRCCRCGPRLYTERLSCTWAPSSTSPATSDLHAA